MSNYITQTHQKKKYFLIYFLIIFSFTWRIFLPDETRGNGIFFQDDLYYYLKIADQFWSLGFFSFDGLNSTNGFQPLWQFILVFLSIFSSGENLIKLSLIINLILIIFFIYFFIKLSEKINLPLTPLIVTLVSIVIFPTLGQFLFNGMETALLGMCTIIAFNFFIKYKHLELLTLNSFLFGLFSGLAMLARLDSFIIFIFPYFFLLIFHRKYFIISALSHILIVSPYLTWMFIDSGSILPISGAVKNFYSTFHNQFPNATFFDYLNYAGTAFSDSLPLLKYSTFFASFYIFNKIGIGSITASLLALLIFLFISLIIINVFRKFKKNKMDITIFFLSILIYLIFQIYFYNYHLIGLDNWTFGFSGFFLLYLSLFIIEFKIFKNLIKSIILNLNKYLFIVLILATQILPVYAYSKSLENTPSFGGANNNLFIKASIWANDNLPEGSIVGSWAAGQLGFHLDYNLLQLEGLVNTNNYLNTLKKENFLEYTCDEGIDYLFLNALYANSGAANFSPKELYRENSMIRTYRGLFLSDLWENLDLVWSAEENYSQSLNSYSSFFIWKVDRAFCNV